MPCVACEGTGICQGICQFDQDIYSYEWEPFVCPACDKPLCGDHRDNAEKLCSYDQYTYTECERCVDSPLCRGEGCPSSKYIDDNTIGCECTRLALGHAPRDWLEDLDKCAEQGCKNKLCKRKNCRIEEEGDRVNCACSICKKIWCSDHKQRIRSCGQCHMAKTLTTNSTRVRHASKNTRRLENISNSASAKQDLRATIAPR